MKNNSFGENSPSNQLNIPLEPYLQADHFPVLLNEVLQLLVSQTTSQQQKNCWVVDCTFGAGGYSTAILQHTNFNVLAIDRDSSCNKYAQPLVQQYPQRFKFLHHTFANIDQILTQVNLPKVYAIVADFGVSSMQLDQNERGFSLQNHGDLNMCMGLSDFTAADFVNTADAATIAEVLWQYGEEKRSKAIAKAIEKYRLTNKITSTYQLQEIIHQAVGYKVNKKGKNSATKSFQAIRIHVNQELHQIVSLLNKAPYCLQPMGKIIAVTFHSIEDRLVKLFFKDYLKMADAQHSNISPNTPPISTQHNLTVFKPRTDIFNLYFKQLTTMPITPSKYELSLNKRSSSAKLRAIQLLSDN